MKSLAIRVALLLALLGSYWQMYQHGREVERASAEAAGAKKDSGDRLAKVIGERGAPQEEQRRAQAQEKARAHAQEERTSADAGAAGHRLRDEAGKLAATISIPGADTAAVARGQAAIRAAIVLSDLLALADERA